MTTSITSPAVPEPERSKFSKWDDDRLIAYIENLLKSLRSTILQLAEPIDVATRRGISLVKFGLTHNNINAFQLIAQGQVDEVLGAKYLGSPKLMHFRGTPMNVQKRIAAGEPIEVAVERPGKSPEIRMMEVENIPERCMADIFVDGRIRTAQEQIARIEMKANKPPATQDDGCELVRFRVDMALTKAEADRLNYLIKKSGKDKNEFFAALARKRIGNK